MSGLTVERLREAFEYSPTTGEFRWRITNAQNVRVGDEAGTLIRGQRILCLNGQKITAAKAAVAMVSGEMPTMRLFHKNKVKSDDRYENLTFASKPTGPLTQARLKEMLDYDPLTGRITFAFSVCSKTKLGEIAGSFDRKGYRKLHIDGKSYAAHRVCFLWMTGKMPVDQIDHINGIKDDNRFENLREVSSAINNQNKRHAQRTSQSGLIGAYFKPKKNFYQAGITVGGKFTSLGCFKTADEAHAAYVAAKRQLHEGCTI